MYLWHFYRVRIDSVTGNIAGITDKSNHREVLESKKWGNLIQIIDDYGDSEGFLCSPKGEKEFNTWTGITSDLVDCSEIRLVENGPVRSTIQVKKKWGLARFTQRISLYPGI